MSYFICIHCMLHLTPTSKFSYLNLYTSTKSYNKCCSNITSNVAVLLQCSAIILQVFLHCAQNLILYICYVVILLQHYVSIFLKRTFLHCCNVAEIFRNIFAIFLCYMVYYKMRFYITSKLNNY